MKIDFFIIGNAHGDFLFYFDPDLIFKPGYSMQKLAPKSLIVSLRKKSLFFLLSIFFYSEIIIAQGTSTQIPLLNTADSLFQSQQWGSAKEKYQQYLKDSVAKPMYWQRLGYCNHQLGLYKDAISNYEKAMGLNPNPQLKFTIEAGMARSYARLGNEKEAMRWLEKASTSGYQDINEINRTKDFDLFKGLLLFNNLYKKIYTNAYPCSVDPKMREFDFWIGEWDVYQNATNTLVGHSVVQKVSGECALLENWDAVSGTSTGKSLNYYDVGTDTWEQDWIGSMGGSQRYVNGIYKDSAMRFSYENITNGKKTSGNFVFYNLGPGKVRQYQDSSDDGGKTFSVSYDFIYIRKK